MKKIKLNKKCYISIYKTRTKTSIDLHQEGNFWREREAEWKLLYSVRDPSITEKGDRKRLKKITEKGLPKNIT